MTEPTRRPWGGLEKEVLAALRVSGEPVPAGVVQAEMGGDLAYGTVTTILSRLRAKGLVVRTQGGRTNLYAPARDEAAHIAHEMYALLAACRDRAAVLARFVSELSAEQERMLLGLLRRVSES
jgi:predicted transcriptional regulator